MSLIHGGWEPAAADVAVVAHFVDEGPVIFGGQVQRLWLRLLLLRRRLRSRRRALRRRDLLRRRRPGLLAGEKMRNSASLLSPQDKKRGEGGVSSLDDSVEQFNFYDSSSNDVFPPSIGISLRAQVSLVISNSDDFR